MRKKAFLVIGLVVAFLIVTACAPKPEKSLLSNYFNAMTLNDTQTMSSMALQPRQFDLDSWEITNVSPEHIEPAILPELNVKELELKKAMEQNVGPTVEAKDLLDLAQEELDMARTAGARAAARKKVEQLQAEYDTQYAKHRELQQNYNEARAAGADEEQITKFSLGVRELPTVRDLTGDVHAKEVDIAIRTKAGQMLNYRLYMRQYRLMDEVSHLRHNGRWIIVRFDPID